MKTGKKKKITKKEFRAFMSLINNEEGSTLVKLSNDFKIMLKSDPSWKTWILKQEELETNSKVNEIFQELHWDDIGNNMSILLAKEGKNFDLEESLFLLANFANVSLKREDISGPLDLMAKDMAPMIEEAQDIEHVLKVFKHYVFKIQGFHGNVSNYYEPDNNYLHKVIEKKIGNPITLSCICLLLAKRLKWRGQSLPLFGIGLPSHFIVQFIFSEKAIFMDPFNRGKILTRKDCVELLRNLDISFQEPYLVPVDSHAILSRTISNLVHIYSDLGKTRQRNQLLNYLQLLSGDANPDYESPY